MNSYDQFLVSKRIELPASGFTVDPGDLNPILFEFQRDIDVWALHQGRAATFAGCGLGKTPMQLMWADKVTSLQDDPVIILAPLAVSHQTIREGKKFGVDVALARSDSDITGPGIYVTNYEKLDRFSKTKFAGVVLDESSILKNFSGATRNALIERFTDVPFRLCCTATPSPNDYMELGNHSEFLGVLTRAEMLSTFFVHDGGDTSKWRLKGHAEEEFWKWVCSWAVMMRKPSDLGYSDDGFILPKLNLIHHVIKTNKPLDGSLFQSEAKTLNERRQARRGSLVERVERCAEIVATRPNEPWMIWCDLNDEADLAEKLIPGAIQVAGRHSDEQKEDRMIGFSEGRYQKLVSKPSIAGFGMNWQHCANVGYVGLSDCYDQKTEALTDRGWQFFNKISVTDKLATVNPDSQRLEWQHPSRVIYEHYVGPMLKFNGQRNFDLMVTPNHNLYVQRSPTRYRRNTEWHLERADQVAESFKRQGLSMMSVPLPALTGESPVTIPIPACGRRKNSRSRLIGEIETNDFLRLAGWYLSEGHCRPLSSKEAGRIVISQTDLHPDHREEIIGLLIRLGLSVNSKTKDITAYSIQLATFLVATFGSGSYFKRIPTWIKRLHPELLMTLRDTMMKGDGNAQKTSYKSFSPNLLDDFQELCVLTGWRGAVHNDYVTIAKKHLRPTIHERPSVEHYEGFIGCATVPNHTLIVRRNGIPVVSGNSYEMFYQSLRRFYRFGQENEVNCNIVTSEAEGAVVKNIQRKEVDADRMAREMVKHMSVYNKAALHSLSDRSTYVTNVESGENWTVRLGDCIEGVKSMADDSVHYSIFSPPFASLYTYSASERDMGNSRTHDEFYEHFQYLVKELYRVIIPGRLLSFHCMNLPSSKERDGVIGLKNFRDILIRMFCGGEIEPLIAARRTLIRLNLDTSAVDAALESDAVNRGGFIYHSEVCIWKDPVVAMQRTKAIGLLHKQLVKDSCMSRQGIPDYFVTVRKPGINTEPVAGLLDRYVGDDLSIRNNGDTVKSLLGYPDQVIPGSGAVRQSINIWQRYASPVWDDINPSDTLQRQSAREERDERHIAPLQLQVIERGLQLWTNPGDLVYSPFTGIGSEGYVALKMGRRFEGDELKASYFAQAVANLRRAENTVEQESLFATA